MDSLTLKACALIMQDQYGLFLQADKEARMNILGSILGLGIYGDMETLAADKTTETNRTIRTLSDKVDIVTAGLPDRAELEAQISAEEQSKAAYDTAAEQKAAEVDGLKVKLNTQLEAAGRVMKLNSKVATLTAQKAAKEATKTAQVGIITAADAILAGEAEITAGVAVYNDLLLQEKELIKGKATYDNLAARKKQITSAIALAESSAEEMRKKKAALTLMKIGPLQQAISREAELTAKHEEYATTARKIAEQEALAPDWQEKKATVTAAEDELKRIEREYETAHTRLSTRVATLKGKVELLSDSGCPDIEKATCKFLSDALEAKRILPEAEGALASLESEYADNRQRASEALAVAQKALDDSLYHQEEIDALRASLRVLEASEKEYNDLEAQRTELKLITERAEELEKAAADAEVTAEKGRTELAEVEKQLKAVETASASYDRLQAEITAAKQWTEKEKQLPVAREKKAAAAQRVLEIDTEIESIEAEITEAKTELLEEQSKTVGKEELQEQVAAVEAEIKALQDAAQRAAMTLGGLKKQLEQLKEKLEQAKALQEQVNRLGVTAAGYEELKKAFSQDGIPHNIIRSIIPIFEATATNILGQMSQGRMSVEFVTEKVLKSNSKKEVTTLDIIINDTDTGRLPYMSRSGGERVKAALSVILALSEIKSSKAGVQLGFLFIDEPPFLDAPGVQAYCDALEAIQQRYSSLKVMAITHDPAMKSRFPQSVDVVKTPEGSKVIYE
jgi:exonuclease SbcC